MNAFFSWQQAILKSSLEPTTKHVCLTIGVHMAGDGSGCFPSYNLIAEESGLGRRTVIDHVQKAVDAGYMTLQHRARDNGSSTSNLYQPTMPGVVQELHPGSAPAAPGVVQELHPHNNPSLTNQVTPPLGSPTKTKATSRATSYARHFGTSEPCSCPGDLANDASRNHGFTQERIDQTFAAFSDHHIAKGSVFNDWRAAFRTWCRNDVKFGAEQRRVPAGGGVRSSTAAAVSAVVAGRYGMGKPAGSQPGSQAGASAGADGDGEWVSPF